MTLLFFSQVKAEESTINFQHSSLTIAVNKTTYPYQFVNKQGQVAGLMVDLWRLWAKKQRVVIKFIPLSWTETLKQVKNGNIDIHAGLSNTIKRQQYFDFSSTFFTIDNYFYINQRLNNVESIEQLRPYTIGVVAKSGHINKIKQQYPQLNIKIYASSEEKYQAALSGEILAFAGIDTLTKNFKNSQAIQQFYPLSKRLLFSKWQYSVAVAKGHKKLLAFIEQGFAQITPEEKSAIERKWLGLDKQSDTLLLTFSSQVSPYMALSPTGRPQGLFVDLWRLWSKHTGQKIDFIAEDLAASVSLVKQQSADVMIAYPENKQNKSGLKKAWHVYQAKSQVYVTSRLTNITSLADLKHYTLGVFITAPYRHQLEKQFPQIKMLYFSAVADMLNAAENGVIDAMVASTDIMNLKLMQTNLQSLFYKLKEPVFFSDLYSLVAPENTQLAKIIHEGFEQIPLAELIALEKKWLPNKHDLYFERRDKMLILDNAERHWLKQGHRVKVGMTKSWRPMEFVNSEHELTGIDVDIINIIAARSTVDFDYVLFDDWESLYQALLDKRIDMAAGISATPAREKKLIFSKPYWELPWVVLHRQQLGQQSTFQKFYGKKIAIVKGYQLIDKIMSDYPQISLVLVDTAEDGLVAVQQGTVDGLLEPLVTASELLKKESLVALMISVMDDFEWDTSSIAVRKDWPELRSIINKGISSIKKTEKQAVYEKWFDVKINTGFDKNIVLRVALQIGILIFIVILVIIIWNRRLHREIKRRKTLEEKMKHMATHDELTGLGNRALLKDSLNGLIGLHQRQKLQLAVLFIDLDGFKNINDTHGHNVGDELLIQLAERLKTSIRTSDILVRFGGDEFVLLLTGLNHGKEASFIAEKILHLLKSPFELSVITTCVSCSIGIALYPDDGITDNELLKVADTLMYKVKAQGKNNYIFNRSN